MGPLLFSGGAPLCAPSPSLLLPSRRLVAPPPVPPSVFYYSLMWCVWVSSVVWWVSVVVGVSLSVGGPPSGASWAACGGSALNAPSWGSPSLSALVDFAAFMLSVRWRASGASWARYARSALNAPVSRLRSLLAAADCAIGICNRLGAFVCGQLCYSLSRLRDNVGHIFAHP